MQLANLVKFYILKGVKMNKSTSKQRYGIFIRAILTIGIALFLSLWGNINSENIRIFIMLTIPILVLLVIGTYTDDLTLEFGKQTYSLSTLIYSIGFITILIAGTWSMLINQQDNCNAIAVVFFLNLANDGVVLYDILDKGNNSNRILTPFRHSWLIQGLIYVLLKIRYDSPTIIYMGIFFLGILMSTLFKVTAYSIRYKEQCLEKDI